AIREKRGIRSQQKLEHIISERTDDLRKEKEEVEHQKEEIERQKEIIDELSSAKDNFFTNISHELRTPLTLVLGPLQSLAHDNTDMPRKWKRNLELAQRNGFRLKQLVDQVLDLARLESGKIEINPVKLDVKAKVTIIMASFESMAGNKNIALKTSVPEEEVCAGVDPDKFQKILNNLVSNAIKFTPEKGTVEVDVTLNDGFVELSVSDNGIGIQKDRIPHIFDRFHSKEGEITGGGYGLGVGLNLTKELVELHGGRITVNSEYGKGSTFLVTLRSCPKTMAKTEEPVFEEEVDLIVDKVPLHSKFLSRKDASLRTKILLVEDNPDMREYISDIFSENNIEITEAENGLEGKKKLGLTKPDVIISDVMMPDMGGFEFSRYVRSVPEHRLTPIMMLTALSDLDNRMQAFDIGVSDYLTKPFVEKELKVRIQNLIRLKDERDEAINNSNADNPEELSEGTVFARKLQAYVTEHIANPHLSVDELGAVVNMSRRQLYRKLKTETGFTPAEFIREIRLFKARHIIENKQAGTISEVAYSVGFSTPFYFAKVYENRFGSHPGKILKG
ncbi:MAG: ATP-binding protein, partial [Balneolales bacterium]|nr:ATP-binding protein [Balneolales bacterium]